MKSSIAPRIVRDISGVILSLLCVLLIFCFGIMPLLRFKVCPVLHEKNGSVYAKGSLAFMAEMEPAKLKKGDLAFYYSGDTPVASKVTVNDAENAVIYTTAADGATKTIAYRKVSGRGLFSVPMLGGYANWLTHGAGLTVSVAVLAVLFGIFAVSATLIRYKDE